MAELGKVDQGGGGTIAYILGNYNMQVIDSGVAVLNMHAPWEIISKADLYEAKCCYETFLKYQKWRIILKAELYNELLKLLTKDRVFKDENQT